MQSSNNGGSTSSQPTQPASLDDTDLTSPANLRRLVLNYLLHHCYTDTAIAFAKDGIIGDLYDAESSSLPSSFDAAAMSSAREATSSGATASSSARTAASVAATTVSNAGNARQPHPLSALPLSRDDSSMEIKVENLLPTTSEHGIEGLHAQGSNGYSNSHSNGRTRSHQDPDEADMEDVEAGSEYDEVQDELDKETDISPDLTAQDLRGVRARKQIKDYIISGQIRQAMDLINAHFPTVLNSAAAATASNNGGSKSSRAKCSSSSSYPTDKVLPANPTSMEPDHLLLNLQIQVFIEAIRSASSSQLAPNSTSNLTSGLPSLATTTPGIANSMSRAASPAPSTTSSNGSATSATGTSAALNPALHSALAYAQGLYASAQKLPSFWRAMYLKELEQVTALLAYTDVEHSPVRRFLHKSRKVALAEQVNSAILFRSGKPSQPLVEVAVRQTTFLWDQLQADEVQVPMSHPVWGLVTGGAYEEATGNGGNGTAKKGRDSRKVPNWKFRSFLQER